MAAAASAARPTTLQIVQYSPSIAMPAESDRTDTQHAARAVFTMTAATLNIPASGEYVPVKSESVGLWWWRHAHILPSFAICLIVCAWFVTWGDWRFFEAERFGGYYDAQGRAMLSGRLDVPPEAIGFEAFVRDGKSYGYFGVAPAVLRLPLLILFPAMDGHWSRTLTLAASMLGLVYAWRLLLLIRGDSIPSAGSKWTDNLLILSAGLGSTTVFLAGRSYTYHEAILWGATFAIMFAYYIARYLIAGNALLLVTAGACCFLSFLSRATAGAGALLVMAVLSGWLVRKAIAGRREAATHRAPIATIQRPWLHATVACTWVLLTISIHLGINYAKFRTFDSVPVRYYALYLKDPHRMQVTGGRQIHLENLRTSMLAYLGPAGIEAGTEFPWVYMSTHPRIFPEAAIDVVEPHSSIPVSMPAMFLLALIGARAIFEGRGERVRALRLPAAGLLIGGAIIFVTVGITQRYLHDLFPFLVVLGAAGTAKLSSGKGTAIKAAALAPLVLMGILLNVSFAYDFQREIVWGVPQQKRDELTHVRSSIDHWMHRPPPTVAKE